MFLEVIKMREHLITYMTKIYEVVDKEYIRFDGTIVDKVLQRPDGSIAGRHVKDNDAWIPDATPEEFSDYMLTTGRGQPTRLADNDLTNIGHTVANRLRFQETRIENITLKNYHPK